MTLKLSSVKRDLRRQDEGEWQPVAEWPGVKLLVRSINCSDYRNARDLLVQRMARKLGRLPTGPELDVELPKLYARHLLRGWEGIDEAYTPELALAKLTDPEFIDLAEQVVNAASRVGQAGAEFVEDAAKN